MLSRPIMPFLSPLLPHLPPRFSPPPNRLYTHARTRGQVGGRYATLYAWMGRQVFAGDMLGCEYAACALMLIDYTPASAAPGGAGELSRQPTCKLFDLVDSGWAGQPGLGYIRSDWRGSRWNGTAAATAGAFSSPAQPFWLAFKGGNGQANHNDVDAGTFVFEMLGLRWAVDQGAGSYGLPGYWDKSSAHGKRYSYYRKSTRGHNTLTFNGDDLQPGWSSQSPTAVSTVEQLECGASAASAPYAVVNMTQAYAAQGGPAPPQPAADYVKRGFAVLPGYRGFAVLDEWHAPGASNLTWAMHFDSRVTLQLSGDGRTANFTAAQPLRDGSRPSLLATIDASSAPSATFRLAVPQIPAPQRPVGQLRKLEAVAEAGAASVGRLQVSFTEAGDELPKALAPLAKWATGGPWGH